MVRLKKNTPLDYLETNNSTINDEEIKRFEMLADQWWDAEGDFAPLHKINPVRLTFIRNHLCAHFQRHIDKKNPLKDLSVLDIGCGGGLICEPISRLGAKVTGIDAGDQNINVAKIHAKRNGLDINYKKLLPEDAVAQGLSFDAVLNLEVIEHVANPESFVEACAALVKPGGVMVCATLNRTFKSLILAKIGAEYILRWLPRGTHDWQMFFKPSEVCALLRGQGLTIVDMKGLKYKFLLDDWFITKDLSVNYMLLAKKML